MTTRQYTGSRYVPLMADPIEWVNTREYEPLTIVLHEGNSYTSRQYVPKGIAITDDAFWAITGNYNAQVEQYRRETASLHTDVDANTAAIVTNATGISANTAAISTEESRAGAAETANSTAISNEVTRAKAAESTNSTAISNEVTRAKAAESTNSTAISNEVTRAKAAETANTSAITTEVTRAKAAETAINATTAIEAMKLGLSTYSLNSSYKVAYIGDSYLNATVNWGTVLNKLLGNLTYPTYVTYNAGAAGFVRKNDSGINMRTLLENLYNAEGNSLDLIVIGAGINDVPSDINNNFNSFYSMCNYLGTNFSNAVVHIFPCLWGNRGYQMAYERMVTDFIHARAASTAKNIVMHDSCWEWLYSAGTAHVQSDGIHPTDTGSKIIAGEMYNVFKAGSGNRISLDIGDSISLNGAVVDTCWGNITGTNITFGLRNWASTMNITVDKRYWVVPYIVAGLDTNGNPFTVQLPCQANNGAFKIYAGAPTAGFMTCTAPILSYF